MNTLAHTYYLKALDGYPHNLAEFSEAISYALGYDENDPDANYLMGRFCMEQLFKFDQAKYHFETALANDINHILTYYYFIRWAIDTNELELAKKLIKYAATIPGICQANLLHRRGAIREKKGNLKKAQKCYSLAMNTAILNSDIDFFRTERNRIKNKLAQK